MDDEAERHGEPVEVILARLEGTINTNFAVIRADLSGQVKTTGDHETRIRRLERETPTRDELQALKVALAELNRWRWKMIGFFSAISALIGIAAAVVTNFIQSPIH